MAAIHPQDCDEVKVDIAEEQQTKQADGKSKKIPKPIFRIIILCVLIYIGVCELISFGFKMINTVPKNAILHRYQILGSCLMIVVGILGILYLFYLFLKCIFTKRALEIINCIEYYCTREEDTISMPWYQRQRFVKIVVAIFIFVFWLTMFEIGHVFYIIHESYIKDKPDLSRPVIYFIVTTTLFGFCSIVLGFSSLIMIGAWIVG